MPTKTVLLTSGTTWTVPSDLSASINATVVCFGAGGGGARAKNTGWIYDPVMNDFVNPNQPPPEEGEG